MRFEDFELCFQRKQTPPVQTLADLYGKSEKEDCSVLLEAL
jgi:hypothetical protein